MLHSPAYCEQGVLLHSSYSALLLQILTSVLSARPAHPDVLAHTVSNFSQEGGGSPASTPPPCPRQRCLYLTFPLTHSLPIFLTLSVFPTHACSDADGGDGVLRLCLASPTAHSAADGGV